MDWTLSELKQKIKADISDDNARKCILKLFANVIEKTHDFNPSNWNVSYRTGGTGLRFQLNFGHRYILGVYSDSILVMNKRESFLSFPKDFISEILNECEFINDKTNKTAKPTTVEELENYPSDELWNDSIQFKIPFSKCEKYLGKLEPAICDFAKWCTENRKKNPQSEDAHVSAFIDYLNHELETNIPQPEYEGEKRISKWVISCNPELYNVVSAFKELGAIDWTQTENRKFNIGDIVYICISKKNQGIRIKTKIEKINIPKEDVIDDTKFVLDAESLGTSTKYMRLRLIENLNGSAFDIDKLKLFDFFIPQGPMYIRENTYKYLSFIERLQKHTELIPNTYDASYELVTEVVKSYAKMQDLSECDYNDLDLIYLSTVGTWKHSVEKKIDSVNKSNLPQIEKERLIAYITNWKSQYWYSRKRP